MFLCDTVVSFFGALQRSNNKVIAVLAQECSLVKRFLFMFLWIRAQRFLFSKSRPCSVQCPMRVIGEKEQGRGKEGVGTRWKEKEGEATRGKKGGQKREREREKNNNKTVRSREREEKDTVTMIICCHVNQLSRRGREAMCEMPISTAAGLPQVPSTTLFLSLIHI